MGPTSDAVGNFSNLLGFTPTVPGGFLLCGYFDNGVGFAVARASIPPDVQPATTQPTGPAPSSPDRGAKPTNRQAPQAAWRAA